MVNDCNFRETKFFNIYQNVIKVVHSHFSCFVWSEFRDIQSFSRSSIRIILSDPANQMYLTIYYNITICYRAIITVYFIEL